MNPHRRGSRSTPSQCFPAAPISELRNAGRSFPTLLAAALLSAACASGEGDASAIDDPVQGGEPPAAPSQTSEAPTPDPTSGEPSAAVSSSGPDPLPQPSDTVPGVGPATPEPQTPAAVDACTRADRLGSFRLYQSAEKTLLAGSVLDRVNPRSDFEVLNESGPCELLGPRTLTCDTPCESGQTCAGDGMCIPTPEKVSVGALTISGLAAPWEVRPNGITKDYSASLADPFPAFAAGDQIELAAGGDFVPAFALSATAVETLTSEQASVPVARGSSASLAWASSGSGTGDVLITFTVNAHGATTGWIECIVPDTGAFDVPEPLVTELIDLGLSGFPRVTVERRSLAATTVEGGCVDFKVASEITLDLEVEGLVSCSTSEECADGQTCSPEFVCGDGE